MTFSILTYDQETGVYAAAAATGSLCVGGWVLRGDIESGLVASQGTAPSTFWRDDVLRRMYRGESAHEAVNAVTQHDSGRDYRQIIALDRNGGTSGFTGMQSVVFADHYAGDGLAVAGNMLVREDVLITMRRVARKPFDDPSQKLLAVLKAAREAGGDFRGLQSAAMLVLSAAQPPLDLRIDHDDNPVDALEHLCRIARQTPYHDWVGNVPYLADKTRCPTAPVTTSS